ncbi:MAG: sulfatase-like hydrolase/transferase [Candidatus Latescibacterota bacterium]
MNLLLISIDSLRLDYVSQTNSQIQTPAFNALTRDFCFYKGLFSASTATRPVHTSLFTGLYPFEHGVLGQSSKSMRTEIPTLFTYLHRAGVETKAFSEVSDIFTGLNYASQIKPFSPNAIHQALHHPTAHNRFLFLHYWGAHTPYGAADQSALGETAQLLQSGQHHIVHQRYSNAVERIFEHQLTPLLQRIDLQDWCVLIFSDHGESWTIEEPYHGCTLRNSVLRVPFYYHIPRTGNLAPTRPILSLIDLFPTMLNLLEVDNDYRGFATDMRWCEDTPYKLAQIHPDPMPMDLQPTQTGTWLPPPINSGKQWALFNAEHKYSYDEEIGKGSLEQTFTEDKLVGEGLTDVHFQTEFARLRQASAYADRPLDSTAPADNDLLDQRLRDLGYLE